MAYADLCRNPKTPRIFGTGSRTEVLVLLAVYGPTPARRVARLWNVDTHSAFDWINCLERSGVVQKRTTGAAYAGLNKAYRFADNVYDVLITLSKKFNPPDPGVPTWRTGFDTTRTVKPVTVGQEVDYLFGSPNRSRILVLVAMIGSIDVKDIGGMLGIHSDSARYAVKRLEEDRLLSGTRVKKRRMVSLNHRLTAAAELRRLLLCVARYHTYYRDLRSAFRIKYGGRRDRVLVVHKPSTARKSPD